ncbi:DUF296 domain-containing protein [Heliobacterium gestii]|uniref:DUF296 domain-containing protein n=1 Tax=Heliomicrobium gestii TaxID=2699 RepID=A0A845LBG3_HELGE|nr:PPC domain-containing DNA-binding protein [Heliomicrobium gestii]MBM7866299.1 putative DNA-binding protein with PD1-like motif [Heliomicrobium gestii]MZP42911.1 DUF296 domain-containing protein [Heliomicrobium gestii]
MHYRRLGSKWLVRLDRGDEIVTSLKELVKKEGIRLGAVSGIGAVGRATIGLFESATKQYHSREVTGDMEIASLTGNISELNGEAYLHLHITLTDATNAAFGGHLSAATISCTGEIIIDGMEGQADRAFSEEIGLNLLKF